MNKKKTKAAIKAKVKATTKARNPQDATMRNVRAHWRRVSVLSHQIAQLTLQLIELREQVEDVINSMGAFDDRLTQLEQAEAAASGTDTAAADDDGDSDR